MNSQHAEEVKAGSRFAFGENWSRFLTKLDDDRICQAEQSLCDMLKVKNLQGKQFLDIGSGSGLFSLYKKLQIIHPSEKFCGRIIKSGRLFSQ